MGNPVCALFAGQSIQEEGMGRELWRLQAAREVLERLKPVLGDDLERLTTEAANAELALTWNAQRAIHACHLGHWFAYRAAHPGTVLGGAVGHSMGVVAALVAAEALSVEDSARFMRERARAFSDICASLKEPCGLAAVSSEAFDDLLDELKAFPGVVLALRNTPTKGTLGGRQGDLEAFASAADRNGWPVKVQLLRVEGPFHTHFFEPCRPRLAAILAKIELKAPKAPVYMGTSGRGETEPARIKELLADQASSCERHLDAVRAAYAGGCRVFLEVSGKPQPVAWIREQLAGGDGSLLPDVRPQAVLTAELTGPSSRS